MPPHPIETSTGPTQHRRPPPLLDEHPLATAGRADPTARPTVAGSLDWRQAVGGALIALGVVAVLIGWYGVSGTLDPAEQLPYISSGGFGGAALIAVGVTLLVAYEHTRDREALGMILDELDSLSSRIERIERSGAVGLPAAERTPGTSPDGEHDGANNGARKVASGTTRTRRRPPT